MTTVVDSPSFNRVWFLDASIGFIVGGYPGSAAHGIILKTTDSGTTWVNETLPAGTLILSAVGFSTPTNGCIGTNDGSILRTTDGGTTWAVSQTFLGHITGNIYFTDSTTGYAVGALNTMYKTTDAGVTWTGLTAGSFSGNIGKIDFCDVNNGFIAGGTTTTHTSVGEIYTTTDGGDTWANSMTSSTVKELVSIDMVNSNLGYAIGGHIVLKYSVNVGIQDPGIKQSLFNAYPNPFNTSTIIDCSGHVFKHNASVEVYNAEGKLMMSKTYAKEGKIFFEKEHLSAGMYICKVFDGQTLIGSGKLTIE